MDKTTVTAQTWCEYEEMIIQYSAKFHDMLKYMLFQNSTQEDYPYYPYGLSRLPRPIQLNINYDTVRNKVYNDLSECVLQLIDLQFNVDEYAYHLQNESPSLLCILNPTKNFIPYTKIMLFFANNSLVETTKRMQECINACLGSSRSVVGAMGVTGSGPKERHGVGLLFWTQNKINKNRTQTTTIYVGTYDPQFNTKYFDPNHKYIFNFVTEIVSYLSAIYPRETYKIEVINISEKYCHQKSDTHRRCIQYYIDDLYCFIHSLQFVIHFAHEYEIESKTRYDVDTAMKRAMMRTYQADSVIQIEKIGRNGDPETISFMFIFMCMMCLSCINYTMLIGNENKFISFKCALKDIIQYLYTRIITDQEQNINIKDLEQLAALLQSWNTRIFDNDCSNVKRECKLTIGGSKETHKYVIYKNRRYTVRINDNKKNYIVSQNTPILLSTIRNKYKYCL